MSDQIRNVVRAHYARTAESLSLGTATVSLGTDSSCCEPSCCDTAAPIIIQAPATGSSCCSGPESGPPFGSGLYSTDSTAGLPLGAVEASLGCGSPTAIAELEQGERVLDLGSGGGIDVLLSAKKVGPKGFVYGLDMTDEMLELAEKNRAKAGADNVQFLRGTIEEIPLPEGSVDVIISNCVINLSADKKAVFAQMYRVLVDGGRIGISDVVADDQLTLEERAERGSFVGCIAGALSKSDYLSGLADAGFTQASVEFTHEVADGMHGAIIRASKPSA